MPVNEIISTRMNGATQRGMDPAEMRGYLRPFDWSRAPYPWNVIGPKFRAECEKMARGGVPLPYVRDPVKQAAGRLGAAARHGAFKEPGRVMSEAEVRARYAERLKAATDAIT